MKKILCLLLATLMLLTVVGCKTTEEIISVSDEVETKGTTTKADADTDTTNTAGDTKGTTVAKPTRGNKTTKKTNATQKPAETGDYVLLDNRTVGENEWKYVEFAKNVNSAALYTAIPSNWVVSASKGGFSFSIDGKVIGSASYTPPVTPTKTYEGQELNMGNGVASRAVYEIAVGNTTDYEWVFSFKANGIDTLYFTVDYTALAQSNVDFMLDACEVYTLNTTLKPSYISGGNGKGRILIAGDTNVNSSEISSILSEMLVAGGKGKYIAVSGAVEGATVNTYATGAWIERIRDGEFEIVFITGFKTTDGGEISKLREACSENGTKLVFLTGYTDNERVAKETFKKFSAVPYVDWKAELSGLIGNGVNGTDLHSGDVLTPTAGYVGAHMIYRSMFGATPPTIDATVSAKAKLDAYVTTGHATDAEELYLAG